LIYFYIRSDMSEDLHNDPQVCFRVFMYVYVWDLNERIFYMVGHSLNFSIFNVENVSCSGLDYKHLSLSQFFILM
jgi:hypothetical protein